MDALIFNTLRRVQAEEDAARREQLQADTNEELAQHFLRNPADLEELAFDLLNLAWSDALTDDITRQVIEVKTVGLGDPDYVEEDLRGMKAYWQGKGGQILSDIIRYERAQMPREEMVAAIDMHQDELALDFWGSFGKLTTQAQEKMRTLPVERLIELVQASITAGATFGSFAAATLADSQIDPILDEVAQRSGGQITILGTNVATRKLAGIGLEFGDNIKEQIFRTGQIGVYKGYPVVQVEQLRELRGRLRPAQRRAVDRRAPRRPPDVLRRAGQGPAAQAAVLLLPVGDRARRGHAALRRRQGPPGSHHPHLGALLQQEPLRGVGVNSRPRGLSRARS